tara:strand:+ start:187 stop:852 length:666 start_codon:yes stop_codon:yes gene_type:complete
MNHNILYTFRRCPYAIRARWALLNTKQEVELREVDLKNKPCELIKISKKATVPVLKTNLNKVIDESLDIMTWSLKKAEREDLLGDKVTSQKIFSLIETNDKVFKYHLDRYKYASRFNNKNSEFHREAAMEIILSLNNILKKFADKGKPLFLVDTKESLADWAIWPFVRQFRIADIARFDQNDEIIFLRSWLNYFFNHHNYPKVMKKNAPWSKGSNPEILGR